jgi:hypothetical protein
MLAWQGNAGVAGIRQRCRCYRLIVGGRRGKVSRASGHPQDHPKAPKDPWSLFSGRLCRVFTRLSGPCTADGLPVFGRGLGLVGSHEQAEQPAVDLGLAHGELDGQGVSIGVRDSVDEYR